MPMFLFPNWRQEEIPICEKSGLDSREEGANGTADENRSEDHSAEVATTGPDATTEVDPSAKLKRQSTMAATAEVRQCDSTDSKSLMDSIQGILARFAAISTCRKRKHRVTLDSDRILISRFIFESLELLPTLAQRWWYWMPGISDFGQPSLSEVTCWGIDNAHTDKKIKRRN